MDMAVLGTFVVSAGQESNGDVEKEFSESCAPCKLNSPERNK